MWLLSISRFPKWKNLNQWGFSFASLPLSPRQSWWNHIRAIGKGGWWVGIGCKNLFQGSGGKWNWTQAWPPACDLEQCNDVVVRLCKACGLWLSSFRKLAQIQLSRVGQTCLCLSSMRISRGKPSVSGPTRSSVVDVNHRGIWLEFVPHNWKMKKHTCSEVWIVGSDLSWGKPKIHWHRDWKISWLFLLLELSWTWCCYMSVLHYQPPAIISGKDC